jgi:hypothetical protein
MAVTSVSLICNVCYNLCVLIDASGNRTYQIVTFLKDQTKALETEYLQSSYILIVQGVALHSVPTVCGAR